MAKRNDHEHRLSHYTDQLLDRVLLEPCWFSAKDHSGAAIDDNNPQTQINWRNKQKWYGIKPSQLDWTIIQIRPMLIWIEIELKWGYNKPDHGQLITMKLLDDRGVPNFVCYSVEQVYNALRSSGMQLHGNAFNIAMEITERHAAAERESMLPSTKPYAPGKAAAMKPTRAKLDKVAAMRAKGYRF